MLDLIDSRVMVALTERAIVATPRAECDGRDRENGWLHNTLDSIDYPMLCVAPDLSVRLMNRAARRELAAPGHPLRLQGDVLQVRDSVAAQSLRRALREAFTLGLRRLVLLGDASAQLSVAVVPLEVDDGAVLLLGRRHLCERLSADWYARERGLTGAETRILQALSNGMGPKEIARRQGVSLSTVRTHVRSVRSKTGSPSIRDLIRQVSSLPPVLARLI
ncbi:helix-turn-helix transcriptional regulator [uncultured Methylibium sp.]|uniref:helix-turn-helix transcriptional regulator n=1 Tax=uncultured Methylibium sp. TaxID=381093 RepID=UPI0025EA88C0|nr:helix-turn-helix transcriptional regulator [uncultured Methylibium sp.]